MVDWWLRLQCWWLGHIEELEDCVCCLMPPVSCYRCGRLLRRVERQPDPVQHHEGRA